MLILDEPTDGLDPNQKHEVRTLIGQMAPEKIIVISTHILEEVDAVCTRAIIIANGRILARRRHADEPSSALARHNAVAHPGHRRRRSISESHARRSAASTTSDGIEPARTAANRVAFCPRTAGRSCRRWPAGAGARLEVDELRVERGQLDEVFREITAGHEEQRSMRNVPTSSGASSPATSRRRSPTSSSSSSWCSPGCSPSTSGGFYERGQADLASFFSYHPFLYLFLVPALSMRLWAEERRSGTIELLMTLPITMLQAVVGKFLAAWCFCGIALALTFPVWLTVNYLGSPDNGVILAAYVGSLLMAGAFLAIGACISATTRNQVIAFVVTVVVCFVFLLPGMPAVVGALSGWAPPALIDAIASLSFLTHFVDVARA